jgi:homoserine kinase
MDSKKDKPIAVVRTCVASGNLGPGYDVLGLALDIFNTYSVFYSHDGKYHIKFGGGKELDIPEGEDNLIVKVIKRVFKTFRRKKNITERPLRIMAGLEIPLKRGLSSSSSAIVAGLLIADSVYGLGLEKDEMFTTGMEFEDHPDGIAASLYGGLVATYRENELYKVSRIPVEHDYRIVLLVTESEIDTNRAR